MSKIFNYKYINYYLNVNYEKILITMILIIDDYLYVSISNNSNTFL